MAQELRRLAVLLEPMPSALRLPPAVSALVATASNGMSQGLLIRQERICSCGCPIHAMHGMLPWQALAVL